MTNTIRISIITFLTLLMATTVVHAVNLSEMNGASLILTNGKICTESATLDAMAIGERGIILAVGNMETVNRYRRSATQVIDLAGDTVLPGFHDTHVHPSSGYKRGCNFEQGSSLKKIQETIAECVRGKKEKGWITGGQWDADSLGGMPDRKMLDKVSPNNPVVLRDISGHSTWANSLALTMSGITRETPDLKGGIIERDKEGHPTGVLREAASQLLRVMEKPPTQEETLVALEWALNEMLSYGITSLTDAAVSRELAKTYVALADSGKLKQRVRLCFQWSPDNVFADTVIAERNLYAKDRICPDCVKLFLDGVPTDSHTAAMLEPYEDIIKGRDDDASRKGLLLIPTDILKKAVTRFDAMGLTVKFHAAGDAAVRQGLDAIEAARQANGFTGLYHNTGHNSFINMDDIRRAKSIAATFEMSPYIWYPNPIIADIAKAIGPERMKRWTPVKDAIEGGGLVVAGSDWNVVPSVNPWIAIETLVTRQRPGEGGDILGESQKITLKQAIDLFTKNSARQMGNGNKTGRIEPGMLADLIVVDRNPYEIHITEVHGIIVKKTIINGEVVYDRTTGK
ncbi:MAG: amidohydrolase [Deltaproteobacteria bacterium]|nr:amidohydrolase [Deltaproteobacteria bacterium]